MRRRRRAALATLLLSLWIAPAAEAAAPAGLTAMADASRVELAWQAAPGATGYRVLRGTAPDALAHVGDTAAPGFSDAGVTPGATYYYAVRAIVGGVVDSEQSVLVRATPHVLLCAGANPVAAENCRPGDGLPALSDAPGIEGFASAQSIQRGEAVDLRIRSPEAFDIHIYRMGWYGGRRARLVSSVLGVPEDPQPECPPQPRTGLVHCSAWSVTATISTSAAWASGVYLLRLVRPNGADNHVLLVLRDDARTPEVLYGVPTPTYQAYNAYGGKSLYDFNSRGATTDAGTARAVKVSFDRPYAQTKLGSIRDWYTRSDDATVAWLERWGYDVGYETTSDLELVPGRPRAPRAYVSGAHDEYVSAGMRAALERMRDGGTGLLFSGANALYQKVRFEGGGRVLVGYKTTEGGARDPSGDGPTGTWRDPAGANRPENGLIGQLFAGESHEPEPAAFPLWISAAQLRDPVWRNTPAARAGTATAVGSALVGWEWDARAANGSEPAGVVSVATSPVRGHVLVDAGRTYQYRDLAWAETVKYRAPSGALVFSTGTNRWNRGLADTVERAGEPNATIQQATTNVLYDMGARPATPAPGIVVGDPAPAPAVPPAPAAPPTGGGGPAGGGADKPGGKRVSVRLKSRFRVRGRRTRVLALDLVRVPRGVRVEARCTGRGCPKRALERSYKRGARRVALTRWLGRRALRAGAVLEVRVLQRGRTGQVVRWTIRRGRPPVRRTLCLPAGTRRPAAC